MPHLSIVRMELVSVAMALAAFYLGVKCRKGYSGIVCGNSSIRVGQYVLKYDMVQQQSVGRLTISWPLTFPHVIVES